MAQKLHCALLRYLHSLRVILKYRFFKKYASIVDKAGLVSPLALIQEHLSEKNVLKTSPGIILVVECSLDFLGN